jgi:hypothetical protein
MLTQKYTADQWALIPRAEWRPFPTSEDRAAWAGLAEAVRRAYVEEGEKAAAGEWPALSAVRYLDFVRDGNRSRYEQAYFARRRRLLALGIAECIEGRGRFLDELANGIWLVCEESSWCLPAHLYLQRQPEPGLPDVAEPVVDLFAAETAALLAWIHFLLDARLDAVSPAIRARIGREIAARVLTPCLVRDDFWWMGLQGNPVNNWNPWIVSNWLAGALLVETDEGRRRAAVAKSLRVLDSFIDPYPEDGGCDEGPGYWTRAGASLFDCLELLHSATGGRIDVYGEPRIQNIGRFIYRVQIAGDYFVNFADASAMVAPDWSVVSRIGRRIGDPGLRQFGAWLAQRQDAGCRKLAAGAAPPLPTPERLLPQFFLPAELNGAEPAPPLPRDAWLAGIQVMIARDRAGLAEGLFVAVKGGHNAESHNHNDVGNFIVYLDGQPLLVDAGVEAYTRQTFSPQRYELWTMQSAWHNLPVSAGVQQAPGREFAAREVQYACDEAEARLTLDIAGAYPAEARLKSWRRSVVLKRGAGVEIVDRYGCAEPVAELALNLLTASEVDLSVPGRVGLSAAPLGAGRRSGQGVLDYSPATLLATVTEQPLTDAGLRHIWGQRLRRITLTQRRPALQGEWTVRVTSSGRG